MIRLEQINRSLFPRLYEAFLIDDDPLSGEREWRNVFDYQWDTEHGHCGYALLDEDRVVGMLGMIFAERFIDGHARKFCNLHTWWVNEGYRGRSLSLLRPLLRLEGYTITHFTPCDTIRAVTKRLGFSDLSSQLRVLLPLRVSAGGPATAGTRITYDKESIECRLDEHDKRIWTDHQPYDCGHLLVPYRDRYCYALYTRVDRHRLPYCHIHYISDKQIFEKFESAIRSSLIHKHRVRFVALDSRLIEDMRLRFSFNFWAPAHALYKSADIKADQIDNLYSDVVFLKLTVLPDISHELWQRVRQSWPAGQLPTGQTDR